MKTKEIPKPRRYQREGIRMIQRWGGRAILGDDPGLGKTPTSLWWIRDYMGPGNVVVVCEADQKINWAREAVKFIQRKAIILEGRTPTKFPYPPPKNQIYIINYDILGHVGPDHDTWVNWLKKLRAKCLVTDECQRIKNRESICTKACRDLSRKIPHVIALSGTAGIEKRPVELFPVLNMVRPDKWSSFFTYATDHCEPKKNPWGRWTFKGAVRLPQLHKRMKRYCLIRRTKEEVLKDLPPVNRIVTPITLPPKVMEDYRKAEVDFVRWLKTKWAFAPKKSEGMSSHRLALMTHLKKMAEESKADFFKRWLTDWLDSNPKKKLLFFGWHTDFLVCLHKAFPGSVLVTGKVPSPKRVPLRDRFNGDPSCRVYFGNLKAGGVGWNCTSSSTTVMGGFHWNPSTMKQAGGRNHGMCRGVEGEPNFEFWFPAVGTIEEKLLAAIEKEQGVQDAILDGKPEGTSELDVFTQLTEIYLKGK